MDGAIINNTTSSFELMDNYEPGRRTTLGKEDRPEIEVINGRNFLTNNYRDITSHKSLKRNSMPMINDSDKN